MTTGAWTAKVQDSSQWLAVDLGREYVITKLQTQGRQGSGEYVSEYMFAFSNDAITWRYYTNEFGIREVLHSFALVLDKTYCPHLTVIFDIHQHYFCVFRKTRKVLRLCKFMDCTLSCQYKWLPCFLFHWTFDSTMKPIKFDWCSKNNKTIAHIKLIDITALIDFVIRQNRITLKFTEIWKS